MKPGKIDQHTHLFSAPKDWDEDTHGPCNDLYVRVDEEAQTSSSAWEPSAEELALLNNGGKIIVHVFTMQPAIAVSVE